jgi:formate C-acetyltransferase
MKLTNCIESFDGYMWKREINVRDFIQHNYTPYYGDESFLQGPTAKTKALWDKLSEMFKTEREKGVYDAETKLPQTLTTYGAGYIDKENEVIVGLQTDAPLKRGIFPKGGIRMVESALKAYGYSLDPATKEIYTKYRKTHNEGVFSAYTKDIRAARHAHIITGLPDAYGRGRIIGDYRRIALYGVNNLIEEKKRFLDRLDIQEMTEECIQSREETSEQIKALGDFVKMCANYGFDVTRPAQNAREAGLDGVVCSPLEAGMVKEACGKEFLTITPGIRFADAGKDDQVRITTPARAREIGSDFIVVGRPITAAEDPVAAYERCMKEFA